MNSIHRDLAAPKTSFEQEVLSRFGLLPNFFCTAEDAPGLIQELWSFAKAAYLDNPLPSAFKERLFVHLSRFCEVRYCVIRHVGFLVGFGNVAGDRFIPPHTVRQALALLGKAVPSGPEMDAILVRLESVPGCEVPAPETQLEGDLFDALAAVFLKPVGTERARRAARQCLGGIAFEYTMALLAFIRTAHYWTETHPDLSCEQDMVQLMRDHPDLARLLMNDPEAEAATLKYQIRQALAETQERAAELAAIVESSNDAIITKNLDGIITSWNSAASRVFGYSAEEIVGKSILTLIPEDLKNEEARIVESIRAGQRIEHFETVRLTKDGKRFDVSLSVSPIKDEKGKVIGASKILRDISDENAWSNPCFRQKKLPRLGAWRQQSRTRSTIRWKQS